jgi:hypothetical protein
MTDTTTESAPLLIYPRPTPSPPGAPVEGRNDANPWYVDDNGGIPVTRYRGHPGVAPASDAEIAFAAENARLREALAEAQRDGANIVACPECGCEFDGDADAARSPREDATTSTTEG